LPPFERERQEGYDDQDFWGTALTLNYTLGDDYTLTSISAYRDEEFKYRNDEDWQPYDGLWSNTNESNDHFSQEIRLVSPLRDRYDWVLGLYYFDSDMSTDSHLEVSPRGLVEQGLPPFVADATAGVTAIPSDQTSSSYAAYGHGNYRFSDSWELTLGLRYTSEEKDLDFNQVSFPDDPAAAAGVGLAEAPGVLFGAVNLTYSDDYSDSHWSPTLGINYRPADDILWYAKYSKGHKSGGYNADFRTTGLDSITYDAESVDAYELGVKSTLFDGALRLNATVFRQEYDDFQVFQLDTVEDVIVLELTNAGEATSEGIEMEATWLASEQLQLTLNATYLDATYDEFPNPAHEVDPSVPANFDGNDLANAPEWKIYAGVRYIQPVGSFGTLTLHVDYSYQDDSYFQPQQREADYIDSFDLWNARATLSPAGDRWELSAWINNISDEEYYTVRIPATIADVDRVTWGSPRLYGLEFSYFLGH
jgi:iron complex outermembrane receptor protein